MTTIVKENTSSSEEIGQKRISDMFKTRPRPPRTTSNSNSNSNQYSNLNRRTMYSGKQGQSQTTSQKFSKKDIEIETSYLLKRGPFDTKVKFKVGCRVMSIINISKDSEESYVSCNINKSEKYRMWEDSNALLVCNGSMGVVESFETHYVKKKKNGVLREVSVQYPRVKYDHGITMTMKAHTWESDKIPGLKVKQVPLILAYALTIHKSQGATLDRACMDLGRDIFAYGQAYVGLSRVRSLEGLYLMDFNANRIRANPKVKEFYEGFYE